MDFNTTHILVSALQLCLNERGLEVECVGVLRGRLLRDVWQAVPHPGVGLTQAEPTSQLQHVVGPEWQRGKEFRESTLWYKVTHKTPHYCQQWHKEHSEILAAYKLMGVIRELFPQSHYRTVASATLTLCRQRSGSSCGGRGA